MMKNNICGIYLITNINTRQMYVGQSIDIRRRWNQHINQPLAHMRIDRAIKKHGADIFELKVICELEQDDDLLNEMEKYYIWKYNTFEDDFHYNLTPGGDFNPMKVPEIAEKISKANSGENNPMFGKKHSEETRRKLSEAKTGENHYMYGKKHSEKTRKKISKALSGENNPMFGKKLSEEHRKKISEAKNTTSYYHVTKSKNHKYRQRFCFRYQYYDDGKRHEISSVDIKKLEKKVKAKGLPWFKIGGDE